MRCARSAGLVSLFSALFGGCGGDEPVSFKDNAALAKPRPGMEATKEQMLKAFEKAKRDPSKKAANLVK